MNNPIRHGWEIVRLPNGSFQWVVRLYDIKGGK